jgi:hypothetical protein
MQDIYYHIYETNHVSRAYSVAAVLYLRYVIHVMLFRPWNMSCFTLTLSVVCGSAKLLLLLLLLLLLPPFIKLSSFLHTAQNA